MSVRESLKWVLMCWSGVDSGTDGMDESVLTAAAILFSLIGGFWLLRPGKKGRRQSDDDRDVFERHRQLSKLYAEPVFTTRPRQRERRETKPFPQHWRRILERNVAQWALLGEPAREQLQRDIIAFVEEKRWEAVGGGHVSEEARVTVAAFAAVMALGLERDPYGKLAIIKIIPDTYQAKQVESLGGAAVLEHERELEGESSMLGIVAVSWGDVRRGIAYGDGNVVIHEMAHQLDWASGEITGTPPMPGDQHAERWRAIMSTEFAYLKQLIASGRESLLDVYALEDEGEFFAVATEYFFQQPVLFKARHPALYQLFSEYFGQDPAGWTRTASGLAGGGPIRRRRLGRLLKRR